MSKSGAVKRQVAKATDERAWMATADTANTLQAIKDAIVRHQYRREQEERLEAAPGRSIDVDRDHDLSW